MTVGQLVHPERIWSASARLHQRGATRAGRALKAMNYLCFRTMLPPEARMSTTPTLMHHGLGVVIHPTTVFGRNVVLGHHVTIAASPADEGGTVLPVIVGDDVFVGAGAILVGRRGHGLVIGDGAVIGAGAVVVRDVPPGGRAFGNPATISMPKHSSDSGATQ